MNGAELIMRVRRQIRGLKNVADEDILELMNDEASLLKSELKLNDTIYEFILDGTSSPYIQFRDTNVVDYGRTDHDLSRIDAWFLEGSEKVPLRAMTPVEVNSLPEEYKTGTRPRVFALKNDGKGVVFDIYPNVAGTYYLSGISLDSTFSYLSEPWGGSYEIHHVVLAYNAAAQLLTEAGEEQRARMALSNYQRHRDRLRDIVPVEKKAVRTYTQDALRVGRGVRRV